MKSHTKQNLHNLLINMKYKHRHVTYPEANRNKVDARWIASNLVLQFMERAVEVGVGCGSCCSAEVLLFVKSYNQ